MGGLCSRSSTVDNAPSVSLQHVNGHLNHASLSSHSKQSSTAPSSIRETVDKQVGDPFSFPVISTVSNGLSSDDINDGIPHLSRVSSQKSSSTKSKQAAVAKVLLETSIDLLFRLSFSNSFVKNTRN